jgi:hypothetical protein
LLCASSTLCAAVDNNRGVFTFDGTTVTPLTKGWSRMCSRARPTRSARRRTGKVARCCSTAGRQEDRRQCEAHARRRREQDITVKLNAAGKKALKLGVQLTAAPHRRRCQPHAREAEADA